MVEENKRIEAEKKALRDLQRHQEKEERDLKRLADEAQVLANKQLHNDLKKQKTKKNLPLFPHLGLSPNVFHHYHCHH
jgi:hypothetical protein